MEMNWFISRKLENMGENGENAVNQHFLLFHYVLSSSFLGVNEVMIVETALQNNVESISTVQMVF